MKTKSILSVSALFAAALSAAEAQSTITAWSFDAGGTIPAPYNSPAATTGSGSATALGMNNNYTFAGGEGPGSITWCDVLAAAGASTGANSYAWRVRGPSNTSGGGVGQSNGWNSQAPIATQGAEFSANTTGYNNISVSVDINATTQAERNLAILYTLDDTVANPTWLLGTITSAGSNGGTIHTGSDSSTVAGNFVELVPTGTGWNNQITATFAGVSSDPNFAVEIVNASTGADDVNGAGNPLNNSSGNWRYDNVIISGTTAVPEPGTLAMGGFGGLMALMAFRRRK